MTVNSERKKQLANLIDGVIPVADATAVPSMEITEIVSASQQAHPGSLFVAMHGPLADGHQFVDEAIRRGAVAIVGDCDDASWWQRMQRRYAHVCFLPVADARATCIQLGERFFAHPAAELSLIGITGTNGKTTTSYLIEQLLQERGDTVGVLGTVAYRYAARYIRATNTTPGPLELQALFAEMVQHRIKWCVMEVSSHALAQRRVERLQFAAAVFTNLGSDHLDYHGTREAYAAAKRRLFTQVKPGGRVVINVDDVYGRQLAVDLRASACADRDMVTFGLSAHADVRASNWQLSWHGSSFQLHTPYGKTAVRTPLVGLHNIVNITGAVAAVLGQPCTPEHVAAGIAHVTGVPGRMECVSGGYGVHVVVDYAHTEAALEAAMLTVRSLQPRRVLVVFGCGGNRDQSKRPAMGRVAGRLADWVCVTSDNPRNEDPAEIATQIVSGIQETGTPYSTVLDRAEAIRYALAEAEPGDCVLIAGKGHEAYQCVQDTSVPFDDRQIARRWCDSTVVTS